MMRRLWRGGVLTVVAVLVLAAVAGGAMTLLGQPAGARAVEASAAPAAAATVTVSPTSGSATDTFSFVLTGFAAGERVMVHFAPPDDVAELVGDLFTPPDDATITADDAGSGRFALRQAEQWGPTPPGTWTVRFTGETSGTVQVVTVEIPCGC